MLLQDPAHPDVEAVLRGVPLFADATDEDVAAVAAVAHTVEFPAGAIICGEGVKGVGLHVIVAGTVSVTSSHSPPSELGVGAYFGEIAVLDGGPRMATVSARTPVTTLAIMAWEFRDILDRQPQVVRHLLTELCARLRQQAATVSQ